MAKAPENTEASRIAALEEWSRGTAEFMASVNERLGESENAATANGDTFKDIAAAFAHVHTRLEALEKQVGDAAHVSRATAENAPIDGDVMARVKRLEQHAGIKQS